MLCLAKRVEDKFYSACAGIQTLTSKPSSLAKGYSFLATTKEQAKEATVTSDWYVKWQKKNWKKEIKDGFNWDKAKNTQTNQKGKILEINQSIELSFVFFFGFAPLKAKLKRQQTLKCSQF